VKGVKRLVVRPRAERQIRAAILYYVKTMQAPGAAKGFVDELQQAYETIKRNPDSGSPRLEVELGMPGVRSWALSRYPYLVIYVRHPELVDVVDVPHTRTNYVTALVDRL
jgi:toxin ParE1/3/4